MFIFRESRMKVAAHDENLGLNVSGIWLPSGRRCLGFHESEEEHSWVEMYFHKSLRYTSDSMVDPEIGVHIFYLQHAE